MAEEKEKEFYIKGIVVILILIAVLIFIGFMIYPKDSPETAQEPPNIADNEALGGGLKIDLPMEKKQAITSMDLVQQSKI